MDCSTGTFVALTSFCILLPPLVLSQNVTMWSYFCQQLLGDFQCTLRSPPRGAVGIGTQRASSWRCGKDILEQNSTKGWTHCIAGTRREIGGITLEQCLTRFSSGWSRGSSSKEECMVLEPIRRESSQMCTEKSLFVGSILYSTTLCYQIACLADRSNSIGGLGHHLSPTQLPCWVSSSPW